MPRRPSLCPTATTTTAVADAATTLHVARRYAIVVAVAAAVVVSLPHSRMLAASRCPLPGPVERRPHVAVHVVVTPLMTLRRVGHGQSRKLALIPSCLDVGPSAMATAPRQGMRQPNH